MLKIFVQLNSGVENPRIVLPPSPSSDTSFSLWLPVFGYPQRDDGRFTGIRSGGLESEWRQSSLRSLGFDDALTPDSSGHVRMSKRPTPGLYFICPILRPTKARRLCKWVRLPTPGQSLQPQRERPTHVADIVAIPRPGYLSYGPLEGVARTVAPNDYCPGSTSRASNSSPRSENLKRTHSGVGCIPDALAALL
jgi:hypothetical protein